MESLSPEGGRHRCLKEERPNDIIGGSNGAFGFSVLLGGIGTGVSVKNAMGRTESV